MKRQSAEDYAKDISPRFRNLTTRKIPNKISIAYGGNGISLKFGFPQQKVTIFIFKEELEKMFKIVKKWRLLSV